MTCTHCGQMSLGTRCATCGTVPKATLRAVALLGLLGCSGEPETPHPPIPDEVEPEMMKAIYGPPPVEPIPEADEPAPVEPPVPSDKEEDATKGKAETQPPSTREERDMMRAIYGPPPAWDPPPVPAPPPAPATRPSSGDSPSPPDKPPTDG